MKKNKSIKIRRALSLLLAVCLIIVTQMSSLNGYVAFSEESDEAAEEAADTSETENSADVLPDTEKSEEAASPDTDTNSGTNSDTETAAENEANSEDNSDAETVPSFVIEEPEIVYEEPNTEISSEPETVVQAPEGTETGSEAVTETVTETATQAPEATEAAATAAPQPTEAVTETATQAPKEELKEAEEKAEEKADGKSADDASKANEEILSVQDAFEVSSDIKALSYDLISDDTGTYKWSIDSDYVLHLQPSEGQSFIMFSSVEGSEQYMIPWYWYGSYISKVSIEADMYVYGSAAYLFANLPYLTEIDGLEKLNLSYVTNASYMFNGSGMGALDVSKLNTSALENISNMFSGSSITSVDLSGWDTSNVTNMSYMFNNCSKLESLDVSGLNTSNVTNMEGVFYNTSNLTEIKGLENWNTSASTTMKVMFYKCGISSLEPISGWDVSNVTDMNAEFSQMKNLTEVDLSKWNATSVTDMGGMFAYSTVQAVIPPSNTVSAKYMNRMFYSCQYLTKPMLSNLVTTAVSTMKEMFSICYSLRELDLSSFDTATPISPATKRSVNVEDMIYMDIPTNLTKITLGPNVTLRENCNVWKTKGGVNGVAEDREVSGIYLSNYNEGPSESNYVGTLSDFYTYQNDAANRVDADGNPISNTYRLCDVTTYDPNGGQWADGSTDVKYTYYAAGDTWSLLSEQPTNGDAKFIGWDRVRDNTGSLYELKTSFLSTGWERYTLYADWEGADKVVYDTNSTDFVTINTTGNDTPAINCEFSIQALEGAPAPSKSTATVSFSGNGSQAIDFGTVTFTRTGKYHYEITQSTADTTGWVQNNGTKVAIVTVSRNDEGETYVSSVEGVSFYNWYIGSILTGDLTDALKPDLSQKNHQQIAIDDGEALYKTAEWTDKENGVGNIDIVYNNTYSDASSTTALYIFTNCTAHDFSSDIAKQNIQFLLGNYDTVIAVCTMKTKRSTDSSVTYEKHIFSSSDTDEANSDAIDAYLDTIYFTNDMHLSAAWQLSCFDACLDYDDPDAVFFSFDGGRGYDDTYEVMTHEIFNLSSEEFDEEEYPEPKLKNYDKTLKKLAQLMKNRAYYIMTPEGSHDYPGSNTVYNTLETSTRRLKNMTYLAMMIVDPVTMSTKAGRDKMKDIIDDTNDGINIIDYVDQNLHATFGTEIYTYTKPIKNVVNLKVGERYSVTDIIDPRFKISGDITITVPTLEGDESYKTLKENTDYTLTITDDTASKGKKLTVKFLEWDGYPTMISVPIKLKDITAGFFDSNDFFDDTNVGDVSATVTDIVYNSEKDENEEEEPRITILSDSPQLYLPLLPVLPTAGGIGTGVFTVCGIALMALAILVLRTRKRYEHKK